jgi:magnesium transporter
MPGSLEYSGLYKDEEIVIEAYSYNEKGYLKKKYDAFPIETSYNNTWINVTGLHKTELLSQIEEVYGISRFTLEDIVQVTTHSKIETFDHYSFSIFKMLYLKDNSIIHEHVSIIKLDNVLITFQETKGDVFDHIRELIEMDGPLRSENIDFLYYRLIDSLIDQYFDILPIMNRKLDQLEENILDDEKTSLEEVYKVRKELLLIKNSVFPMKQLIGELVKTYPALPYKDVYDHLEQIIENVALNRELISSLYDTHMSNLSHKMNKVMTTLAIFSAIFIPLSFLAGFFGMNFKHFPGLNSEYSLLVFILACIALGIGMLGFFKHKKMI